MTIDALANLNPAQKEAVEHTDGPLLIIAGPGSGKTRVIAHRIAHLIGEHGVPPGRIIAVTFTNKAAREMRERVSGLLGDLAAGVTLGTFHAICARMLRIDGAAIGIDRSFVIYDEADQLALVKRALQDLDLDERRNSPRGVLSLISRAKNDMYSPQAFAARVRSYPEEIAARVYRRYEELLEEAGALDFDDLLLKAVQLFRERPEVLQKYAERYRYVLIDEFQDTNPPQYLLARQLAGIHGNIAVVGDPDQSIYSWRSADIRNILNFERDFPGTRVIQLERNYRSTQTILDAAMRVIAANPRPYRMRLEAGKPQGAPVTVYEAYDEEEEAAYVARVIQEQVKAGLRQYRDFAVMYRTNAQSRAPEEAFVGAGIRYRLVGGTRFYERKEIRDLIAYLRVTHNPLDSVSLLRVINMPPRGLGARTVAELQQWAAEMAVPIYSALQVLAEQEQRPGEGPGRRHPFAPRAVAALLSFQRLLHELRDFARVSFVPVLLDEVLARTEYRDYLRAALPDDQEERLENIEELRGVAEEYVGLEPQAGLASFLEDVTLVSDVDELDERVDAVTLITLHAAKGLEFPCVFILGLEEGVLPHQRTFDDPKQIEEECRLAYVGITRAKDELYLTRAFRRSFVRSSNTNPASRFLQRIPPELVIVAGRIDRAGAGFERGAGLRTFRAEERSSEPEPALLSAGDRVRHAKFGEGIVVEAKPSGQDQEVTVAFTGDAGIKRLLLSFAPLERLT